MGAGETGEDGAVNGEAEVASQPLAPEVELGAKALCNRGVDPSTKATIASFSSVESALCTAPLTLLCDPLGDPLRRPSYVTLYV